MCSMNSLLVVAKAHPIQLLRRNGNIPEGQDEAVFKNMLYEDMQAGAVKVNDWCHLPTTSHPVLDILREAIDLKKLNINRK